MKTAILLMSFLSLSFLARSQDSLAIYKQMILGKWISTTDKKETNTYTADGFCFIYFTGDKHRDQHAYAITYKDNKYILTLKDVGDSGDLEHEIQKLTSRALTLSYSIEGRQETTTYYKPARMKQKTK